MSADRIVVVGGGLAGITAALTLTEAGLPVTVLEARPWLGGATWSFGRRGLTIDNGQHAFLRSFTAYRELLAKLGTAGSAPVQERLDLTVFTPDGPLRLRRSSWPAPLHLTGPLARYRSLSVSERLSVVPAALSMWLTDLSGPGQDAVSIGDWLERHGQGDRVRRQFWDMFLLPFLNATAEQADLSTAAGLINATLLSGRDHADLAVPSVPLRDVHGGPAARLLARRGAEVRLGSEVTSVTREPGGGYSLRIAPGDPAGSGAQLSPGRPDADLIRAAGVVLAVPAWNARALVPADLAAAGTSWQNLEPAPVMSVHVIYDAAVTKLPFAAATGSALRWVIDKTRSAGLHTGQYLAASVPAARQYVDAPVADLREQFLPELERLFPAAATARVEDFFVTRERRAAFRPVPGSRALRPGQSTQLPGFALAGAWTDTGWPDTMESAVRSGLAAADAVIAALAGPRSRASAPAPQRVPAPRAERAGPRRLPEPDGTGAPGLAGGAPAAESAVEAGPPKPSDSPGHSGGEREASAWPSTDRAPGTVADDNVGEPDSAGPATTTTAAEPAVPAQPDPPAAAPTAAPPAAPTAAPAAKLAVPAQPDAPPAAPAAKLAVPAEPDAPTAPAAKFAVPAQPDAPTAAPPPTAPAPKLAVPAQPDGPPAPTAAPTAPVAKAAGAAGRKRRPGAAGKAVAAGKAGPAGPEQTGALFAPAGPAGSGDPGAGHSEAAARP
jgi:squalene-associated FAD-dependent desaturase